MPRLYCAFAKSVSHQPQSPLFDREIEPPEKTPFSFYRITQQGYYAIPLAASDLESGLADGRYIVSMHREIQVRDRDGDITPCVESLDAPHLVRDWLEHSRAGVYDLKFPLTVEQGGQVIGKVVRSQRRIQMAELTGTALMPGLSTAVPPVFLDRNVTLFLPSVPERWGRLILALRTEHASPVVKRVDELLRTGEASFANNSLTIQLGRLIFLDNALYHLNLHIGLEPILPAPLQFTMLTTVVITPPQVGTVFSPLDLPRVRVEGLGDGEIHVPEACEKQVAGEAVELTWHDLRSGECQLSLQVNNHYIPLTWAIQRVSAWFEVSGNRTETIFEADFANAVVHVRGSSREYAVWHVGEHTRQFQLSARGAYDQRLSTDALMDMIREQPATSLDLEIEIGGERWYVATLMRQPEIQSISIDYDGDSSEVLLRFAVGRVYVGSFIFRIEFQDGPYGSYADFTVLGTASSLSEALRFPVSLSPGRYLLQIICDDISIDLDPSEVTFEVASTPKDASEAHTELGASEASLLIASAHVLSRSGRKNLGGWISAVIAAHDAQLWQSEEQLPCWAVFAGRAAFTTDHYRQRLIVVPEKAAMHGQVGTGHANLKLDGDTTTTTYVRWEPDPASRLVRVYVMVPPTTPEGPYHQLDEYDLWPVYVCERCGRLVGSREGNMKFSPRVWIEHRHEDERPRFKDVVYDNERTSFKLLANLHAETPRQTSQAAQMIEGELTARLIWDFFAQSVDGLKSPALQIANPLFFRSAFIEVGQIEAGWLNNWRGRRALFQKRIQDDTILFQFPAVRALWRMISAFEGKERDNPLVIDLLVIAFLLRAQVEPARRAKAMLDAARIDLTELSELGADALVTVPPLFHWALVWSELLFVHSAS